MPQAFMFQPSLPQPLFISVSINSEPVVMVAETPVGITVPKPFQTFELQVSLPQPVLEDCSTVPKLAESASPVTN